MTFPFLATALTVFLVRSPAVRGLFPSKGQHGNLQRIALIQKDSLFQPIPSTPGSPQGEVWYSPAGDRFSFQLSASGLVPHHRYELDLTVDDVTYTLASRPAKADGSIAIDTTLDQFAEGACVGANYHQPLPVRGRHRIKFAVKNDGSPSSGTAGLHTPGVVEGADLPCAGNGDENYSYVLYEADIATFDGRARQTNLSRRAIGRS